MIQVLHLITSLDTGGAEVMLARLMSQMDRARFDNVVVSLTDDGPIGERIRKLGVPVFSVGMRRGSPNPGGVWRTWRLLRRQRPDIVQTWLYHSDLVGLIAGRAAGIPAIIWNVRCSDTGDMYAGGLNGSVFRVLAWLSPWTSLVIANSHAGREFHELRGYAPPCWKVIPNGYDTEEFRPREDAGAWLRQELGLSSEHLLVGLVARYDPLKDHYNFLQAARQFASICPSARFVMVGSRICSSNSELKSLIAECDLERRVYMLGERSDVARITAGFDIANCSSSSEGFPNVVAEAMACGVPCVATDVGDVAFLLGDAGMVVPAGSPASFVEAWRELMTFDSSGRQELGARARRLILARYSLEAVTRQYEAVYESFMPPHC